MVTTRRQKQAVAAASNPLRDAGILQHVFTFLPGNWLLLGAVCREWKLAYAGLEDQQVRSGSLHDNDELVNCDCRTTLYSAVVASPATVRLAHHSGLAVGVGADIQVISGLHADIPTLGALQDLGMPFTDILVEGAARSGRLDILQHLITDQQCPVPRLISHYAARSGSISMLDWLRAEDRCVFDDYTCAGAACDGHIAALQHLRSCGCDWENEYIACQAASGGSIELVEWLRQQPGVVVDAEALAWAASADQVHMCKHLRSTGCEWDASTCQQAAIAGAISALRWLRENGCPWNASNVCISAAFNGFTSVLDYVVEQGEVLDAETLTSALNRAGSSDKLQAAQWLRERGAEWPAVLAHGEEPFVEQWYGDTLAWARAEGCTSPVTL
jgi:hypothetical protein